jgi:hypothetical protein
MRNDLMKTNTHDPVMPQWLQWIYPIVIGFCQIMALVAWIAVMLTLTPRWDLAIPYAFIASFGISSLLALVFTKSAITAKAIEILFKSPGGVVIVITSSALVIFIWRVQPILVANGYMQIEAWSVTLFAQVPLAMASSFFSSQFLSRVFNEKYYQIAMDAVIREVRVTRQIELAEIIRMGLKDIIDTVGSDDKEIAKQVKHLLAESELKLSNMSTMVTLLCEKRPKYMPKPYGALYDRVHVQVRKRLLDEELTGVAPTLPFTELESFNHQLALEAVDRAPSHRPDGVRGSYNRAE